MKQAIDITTPETQFGIFAIQEAIRLIKHIQSQMDIGHMTKKDESPVTLCDLAVQALIGYHLRKEFPEDVLVAEESSSILTSSEGAETLKKITKFISPFISDVNSKQVCEWIDYGTASPAKRFWTLDPIDGTKGFLRGDQYAVALALICENEVQLGLLGCPNLTTQGDELRGGEGSIVVAQKGNGAWIRPLNSETSFEQLQVSSHADTAQLRILRSVEASHTNSEKTNLFLKHLGIKSEPIYMDSQAKYVVVAKGAGDLFFYLLPKKNPDYRMKIWDVAPGAIVVEEAGGTVTDLKGGTIDYGAGKTIANNPGLLVTNGQFHAEIVEALNQVSSSRSLS